jgi:hypothetical protein
VPTVPAHEVLVHPVPQVLQRQAADISSAIPFPEFNFYVIGAGLFSSNIFLPHITYVSM